MWVSPFRYPRIKGYLLLPVAFRSLSRLSSALSAKASTLRSFQLNLLIRVRVCSLIYVRSVGRLGSWFFQCVYKIHFDTLFLTLITTTCRFAGRTFTFFEKQRSCFLPRFWMSLSFNSLRFVFGFQGTYVAIDQLFTIIRNATHKCFAFISSRASHYVSP